MTEKLEVRKYKVTHYGQDYDWFLDKYRDNLVEETEVLEQLPDSKDGVQIFTGVFNINKSTIILRYKWTEGTTLTIGGTNKRNLNETIKQIKSNRFGLVELVKKG